MNVGNPCQNRLANLGRRMLFFQADQYHGDTSGQHNDAQCLWNLDIFGDFCTGFQRADFSHGFLALVTKAFKHQPGCAECYQNNTDDE